MAMTSKFALPLLLAVLMLLVVSGSARRVEGDKWAAAGEAASGVGHPTIQFIKRLYLQQLAVPCPNGMTYDPNSNPHCH